MGCFGLFAGIIKLAHDKVAGHPPDLSKGIGAKTRGSNLNIVKEDWL